MSRLNFALEAVVMLFVVSTAVGLGFFWRTNLPFWPNFAWVAGVPATASILLLIAISFSPGLMPAAEWRFPMHLTLPGLHALLMATLSVMVFGPTFSGGHTHRSAASLWSEPILLAASVGAQALLTFFSYRSQVAAR